MKTIVRYIDNIKSNIVFYIGQNAMENYDIIDSSKPDDLWFHIKSVPSCHVIASIDNLNYDKKQLHKIAIQGAMLCKQNSKYKSDKKVDVIYCNIQDVKKSTDMDESDLEYNKKSKIGSVILQKYKTIVI